MTHVRGQDWGLSLEQGVVSSFQALRPAGSPRQQTLILGQNIFICKNIDYHLQVNMELMFVSCYKKAFSSFFTLGGRKIC